MDDGGRLDYNKGSKNKSLVMNTHSFTEFEVISMAKELKNKLNLLTEIRSNKSKKIIVINSASYEQFISLIHPYIIPEMEYKLP
jgi:LAGLIDADG DNA endonuclease family